MFVHRAQAHKDIHPFRVAKLAPAISLDNNVWTVMAM